LPILLLAADGQFREFEAVLDTGFSDYLALPPNLVTDLQLPYYGEAEYELGDGRIVRFTLHTVTILWDGANQEVHVLATEGGVLVGMRMLYGHQVYLDVVDGGEVRIEPRP
jgi:clan AA aspartic protease